MADAELTHTQRLAEAEAAANVLRETQGDLNKQAEVLRAECESLRTQMQDVRLREDHARL